MSDVDIPTEINLGQIGPVGLYAFSFAIDTPFTGLVVSIVERSASSVIAEIFGDASMLNMYIYENESIVLSHVESDMQTMITFVEDVLRSALLGLDSYQVELNQSAIPSHIDFNVVVG